MAVCRLLWTLFLLPLTGTLSAQIATGAAGTGITDPNCHCKSAHLQPYTVEFKTTTVRTLANGVTITHAFTEVEARDAQGRFYHSSDGSLLHDSPRITHYSVTNSHAGTTLKWTSDDSKQAELIQEPPKEEQHGCWATDSGRTRWTYGPTSPRVAAALNSTLSTTTHQQESLGTTTMFGVEVTGDRFTQTTPTGAMGNDGPLVSHNEVWRAKGIGVILKSVNDDPQSGTMTREATNLTVGDPDPSLFQPPSDYEVKTETLHQVDCEQ